MENISFIAEKGDYVVLLGESGAGKSLILEIIAGLIIPDNGEIWLSDNNITNEKIQKRNIGLVFQDNAVFPHLNVRNNIAFPLKARKEDRKSIDEKIIQLTKKTGIEHLLQRWPEARRKLPRLYGRNRWRACSSTILLPQANRRHGSKVR